MRESFQILPLRPEGEKGEDIDLPLNPPAQAVGELPEINFNKEELPEGEIVLTLDEIKDILVAQLGDKAEVKKLELQGVSGGVHMSAELDAGLMGGKIVIEGLIVNAGDKIAVDNLEIEARGYVKSRIEGNLSKLVPAIEKHFENKYKKPVSSLQIASSGLVVGFEKGQEEASSSTSELLSQPEITPQPFEATGTIPLVSEVPEIISAEPKEGGGEKKKKSRKRRVAIVDTSEALEEQARDMAEERMTANKEELRGLKGFFSKIWKHNLAHEYYRQKEIALAKTDITSSGNLYVGEGANQSAHDTAMNAVVSRFTSEYEETLHEGESRHDVSEYMNNDIRTMIREFAAGIIDEDTFRVERDRMIAVATGFTGEKLQNAVNHTDNLFEVARQAKMAVDNGIALDDVDEEIELVIGKARIGVRTEAKYNAVDRIAEKIKSSKVGRFVNETTVTSGVAIAYAVSVGLSQRLARSKALAWGTFGTSAIVGGVIAGARESVRVEDERRQHGRERAKGKEMTSDMDRRVEMETARYATISAKSLCESLNGTSNNIHPPEEFLGALNVLSEVESRIKLSDREDIDLISYTDFKSIEEERFQLDIARAEAKVRLRSLVSSGEIVIPGGKSFDEFYQSTLDGQARTLREGDEGMEAKDKLFKKIKVKKVGWALAKTALTGLGMGVLAQEAVAFVNSSQEGILEHSGGRSTHSTTVLEGIRQWIKGEHVAGRVIRNATLSDGSNVKLPDGVDIVPNPGHAGHFLFTKDGEVISDEIEFNGGKLTAASEDILKQNDVNISDSVIHTTKHGSVTHNPQEVVNNRPDLFSRIHRKFWYDNNTPVFDRNELKLHWGGTGGTGIDSNGHYVFNAGKMTPDGSFYRSMSIDAQEAMKNGQLKLIMSLSRDSQFNVVEVPIDARGNVDIDPTSDIAKMFFKNDGGRLKFIGKFAEVAHAVKPGADGVKNFEILATAVGPGAESVTQVTDVVVDTPVTSFDVVDNGPDVFPPLFIPLNGRTPLERMKDRKKKIPLYGYGFGYGPEAKKQIEDRKKLFGEHRSKTLEKDPKARLDPFIEAETYLNKQEKEYTGELRDIANQAGPMGRDCKLSICIPVAGHQEGKNIYRSLENYSRQKADKKDYEILLLVNHPEEDREGKSIKPDDTLEEIERFRRDYPDMPVRVMYKVLPLDKAKIWYVRKLLNDAALLRSHDRGNKTEDLIMVSNDADNKGVAPQYINNFIKKFDSNENVDGYLGQLDWDPEAYTKEPVVHIGTRFFQYMSIHGRKKASGVMVSSGANFAFRSSIYSGVGGYIENENEDGAEDINLGWAISDARGQYDKPDVDKKDRVIQFAGARVSRLYTSARRALHAWQKQGLAPLHQWDKGFSPFDDEVRGIDAGGGTMDYDDPSVLSRLKSDLENVLNQSLNDYVQDSEIASKGHKVYRNAISKLGIKYTLDTRGDLVITDMSKLIDGLKDYQKYALAQRKAKSGDKAGLVEFKSIRQKQNTEKENKIKAETEAARIKEDEADKKLETFYSTDKSRLQNLPDGLRESDVTGQTNQEDLDADYVSLPDVVISDKETGKILGGRRKSDGKPVIIKDMTDNQVREARESSLRSEGVDSVEDYLKSRSFNSSSVQVPEKTIHKDKKLIRIYEAGVGDLDNYLRTGNTLSTKQALALMIRVCDGVRALHKLQVVHGDISPSNIILFNDGVKLGDLDGATVDTSGKGFFGRRGVIGNRFVMAPEMFNVVAKDGSTRFGKTADIYEAGVTLFRLLAGKWPYYKENTDTRRMTQEDRMNMYRVLHESGNISFPPNTPTNLQDIIRKAMQPNPKNRYASMDEMTLALVDAYQATDSVTS